MFDFFETYIILVSIMCVLYLLIHVLFKASGVITSFFRNFIENSFLRDIFERSSFILLIAFLLTLLIWAATYLEKYRGMGL